MNRNLALAFLAGAMATAAVFYVGTGAGGSGTTPIADSAVEPAAIEAAVVENALAPAEPSVAIPVAAPKAPARRTPAKPEPRNFEAPPLSAATTAPEAPAEPIVLNAGIAPAIELATTPANPPIGSVSNAAEGRRYGEGLFAATEAGIPVPPRVLTIPEGTLVNVRLEERLASDRNIIGDQFVATLAEPLVIDGWVIAERGARAYGRVVDVAESGRVRGKASIAVELSRFNSSDGQRIDVRTARFTHGAESSKKDDAVKVGVGAAIGAAIGAAVSGGKGAAIGAAAGGAAGGGAVAWMRGDPAVLDVETRIPFRLDQPVTVTERN